MSNGMFRVTGTLGEEAGAEMTDKDRPLPRFLTAVEVADMLRMSERTLEGMRLAGRGPAYIRLGQGGRAKVIYNLRDVEVWLEKYRRD